MQRRGSSGPLDTVRDVSVVVPNITDGDTADVAVTADLIWKSAVATPLLATMRGAPLANLGIVAAWVSNIVTGVVMIRFSALTGNVATGAQLIRISEVPGPS